MTTYLSLRHQEPSKDEAHARKASEEDEAPVPALTHRDQHIRHRARDHQVEQPLRRGRNRHVDGPEPRRWDLADVNPAHGPPAPLEERREEVDADERHVAGRRDGLALLRRRDAHVQAHVHHAAAHGDGGPEEGAPAAQRVGGEDEEAEAHEDFDDAVDAGGEEAGFGAVEAKVGEDLGGVVVDCVGA